MWCFWCYFYWPLASSFLMIFFFSFSGQKSNENLHQMLAQVTAGNWPTLLKMQTASSGHMHYIYKSSTKSDLEIFLLLTCHLTIYCRIGAQFAARWALLFTVIWPNCCSSSCGTTGSSRRSAGTATAAACAGWVSLVAFTGQRLRRAGDCK